MRGDVGRTKGSKDTFSERKLYSAVESGMQSHNYLLGNIINGLYSMVIFETMGI